MRDREFLNQFHKRAKKKGMNVEEYNRLMDSIAQVEKDLKRLRDPLRVNHPPVSFKSAEATTTDGERQLAANLWNRTQQRLQNLMRTSK